MSHQHKLEQHLHSLNDINEIMSAMKNLSLMEANKLARFIENQKRVVNSILSAAEDFLSFHPEFMQWPMSMQPVLVVIGTERGFCGNYNEKLQQHVDSYLTENPNTNPKIIAVGYKLHDKLAHHAEVTECLYGPNVTEEVNHVIEQLISTVKNYEQKGISIQLLVMHNENGKDNPVTTHILPAFQQTTQQNIHHNTPAQQNLSNSHLFSDLVDEYVFAALNDIFYDALMTENQRRVQHLESAVHQLSEKINALSLKRNEIRQEEITEEIEVIMLSANILE